MFVARVSFAVAVSFVWAITTHGAADPDLALRARAVLRKHCMECHGDKDRRGDLSVLDRAGMDRPERPFINAVAESSELMQLIEDGSMPPGDRPKLTPKEMDLVRQWINSASPAYPKQFDDIYVLNTVLADVKNQPAGDRPRLRYFSIADLVADDDPAINLNPAREALRQALNQVSMNALPPLEPADAAATVFRVDLAKTGWDMKPFERRVRVDGKVKQIPSDVNLYDLILVEYPLGRIYPNDAAFRELANVYLKPAHHVRPLAFMRGEWFAREFLASPVAAEIRSALGRPAPTEAAPQMPKSLRPPDAPSGSIAMLPLDSVSARNSKSAFNVDFELWDATTERPKSRFVLGDQFYFYVLSARDAHIEIVWKDATGKCVVPNFDEKTASVQAGKDKLIAQRLDEKTKQKVPYKLTGSVPGREYLTIFVSEQRFPAGEVLKTREHLDERVIHRFYLLPGEKSQFEYDPAKIVRKTIDIEISKKE